MYPCVSQSGILETLSVLVSFSVAVGGNKSPDKSNLMEKGLIWHTVPGYSPSWQGNHGSRSLKQLVTSHAVRKQEKNTCMPMLSFLST